LLFIFGLELDDKVKKVDQLEWVWTHHSLCRHLLLQVSWTSVLLPRLPSILLRHKYHRSHASGGHW
jgi:hypothetical protein